MTTINEDMDQTAPSTTTTTSPAPAKQKMTLSLPILAIVLILSIIIAGVVGYLIGSKMLGGNMAGVTTPGALNMGPESVVKSQQATAVGTISKKENKTITVVGTDGQEVTYQVSDSVVVYSATSTDGNTTAPTKGIDSIATGKAALITLGLENNQYVVKGVAYLSN